jgi:uncharacterized protein YjdB/N-acetylmuramoyl-L-alanine amidase CwlA
MRKILFLSVTIFLGMILISCTDGTIPVFNFSESEVTIEVGETYDIGFEATEGFELEWSVTPDDVIELTDNQVKGLKVGDANVTVAIKDTEISATFTVHVIDPIIDVDSLTISGLNAGTVGENVNLTVAVSPDDATDQSVTWSSSDEMLATVSNEGVVTLLATGTVTITATSSNAVAATHEIIISEPVVEVESVTISGLEAGVVGETINLSVSVLPDNVTDSSVTWSSSNETLATVSNEGVVSLLAAGSVIITATSANAATATHEIMISEPVVEVESLTISGLNAGVVGDDINLTVAVLPENATNQNVVWSSSDESLATVSDEGVVTLISAGTVTITATSNNEVTATHDVTISEPVIEVESVTISGLAVGEVGETIDLSVTIMPNNASHQDVVWSSSDETLATVSNLGVVTLLAPGEVIIHVATLNDVEDQITITINDATQEVVAFIGEVSYKSIQEAIDAAAEGSVIEILKGQYNEELTINKSFITFTSKDDSLAVLETHVTLASGITDITFTNLEFTGNATIVATANIDQFVFTHNKVYDTTLEKSSYYPSNRVDVEAFIRLYTLSGTNVVGDVIIENNTFENMSSDIISIARTSANKTISIKNNEFYNFPNSAIRFDGGYNSGDYVIENNIFKNDTLSGYNAILFRAYSPSSGNIQNIYIQSNTFENIGDATLDRSETYPGSAVIATSTFNDKETHIYILNNDFIHTVNSLHLRNVTSTSNWHAEIHGNAFINPVGYVFFETLDEADFNENYIIDENNNPITDETTLSELIIGNTKYEVLYTKEIDLLMSRFDEMFSDDMFLVDSSVSTMASDEVIEAFGYSFNVGQTAFATINDALIMVPDNAVIYLSAGTYDENITIEQQGLMFIGPNMNVDVDQGMREQEAILTGDILITVGVHNTSFNGLTFSEDAKITNNGPIDTLRFAFNIVESSLSYATGYTPQGFMTLSSSNDDEISKNIILFENSFNFTGDSAPRYLLGSNIENLYVVNNTFESSTSAFTDIIRITGTLLDNQAGSGISGDFYVFNNTFNNAGQSAMFITTYTQADIQIVNNVFDNIRTSAVRLRYSDDVANESSIVFNYNKVSFDEIYTGYPNAALRVERGSSELEVIAYFNHFVTVPEDYYIGAADNIVNVDARYNYYEGEVDHIPQEAKFQNVSLFSDYYLTLEELPIYEEVLVIQMSEIHILNKIESLEQLESHILEVSYLPENATHTKLIFESSDDDIATIDAYGNIFAKGSGDVTITVYSENDETVLDSFTFNVIEAKRMDVQLNGSQALLVGESAQVDVTVYGSSNNVTYASSDDNVLIITNDGFVQGISEGEVEVTVTLDENNFEVYHMYVYSDTTDPLLAYLLSQSAGNVNHDLITYIGSNDGSLDYDHLIGASVNQYLFNDELVVNPNMIPTTNSNYSGDTLDSFEWIVVHDTANTSTSAGAQANSNWATNTANTSSSWHYTVGNDGVFQQLPDNIVGWHAGDGTSVEFEFYKTDVLADGMFPEVTVSDDGYYVINGTKTTVVTPLVNGVIATESDFVENGIRAVVGDDGYYYLPLTYQTSGYGQHIAMHGGNLNSIGIETAVNKGSDVWLTWQKTAKLVASLLITYDLSLDRVVTHNHFSGKTCPRTMMTSNHLDDFYEMVEAEYMVMKNYSDYTIEFESLNTDIMDHSGRVINVPQVDTVVEYKLTITTPSNETYVVTLSTIVEGTLF